MSAEAGLAKPRLRLRFGMWRYGGNILYGVGTTIVGAYLHWMMLRAAYPIPSFVELTDG